MNLHLEGYDNIAELMEAEADFAGETPGYLRRFSPHLLGAYDRALGMYTTFARDFGQSSADAQDYAEYVRHAQALGAVDAGEVESFRAARHTLKGKQLEHLKRLEATGDRILARVVRGVVLIQMGRSFSWQVADLLRMRLTAAIGLQRPIVEGYGLLCLMRDDPSIAIEWSKVDTEDGGSGFHDKYQRRLKREIRAAGLVEAYNKASGMSLHLRFSGTVHGLRLDTRRELSRVVTETKLLFAELRDDTASAFIVQCLDMLRTQARLFMALPGAIPEVTDPVLIESRIPRFVRMVEQLYPRFRTAFPEEAHRLEAKYGPLPILGPPTQVRQGRIIILPRH